jgi:(p)ppGpp synthase/HD superfamily hydrolase
MNPSLLSIAESIARQAHIGQKYGGDDYFERHIRSVVRRVADAGYDDRYLAVAFLHDTLEDSNFTVTDLRDVGIPEEVIAGVVAMTKPDGVDYFDYLIKAAENQFARVVKYHDMKENLSNNPKPKNAEKYRIGISYLESMYEL